MMGMMKRARVLSEEDGGKGERDGNLMGMIPEIVVQVILKTMQISSLPYQARNWHQFSIRLQLLEKMLRFGMKR